LKDLDIFDLKQDNKENKDKNEKEDEKETSHGRPISSSRTKISEKEESVLKDTIEYIMDKLEYISIEKFNDVLGKLF
jgi:hypothetical protein